MAPKGRPTTSKRAASGSPDRAKKRPATNVVVALKRNTELPTAVVECLCSAASSCLNTFADKRHPYQSSVFDMIGQALDGLQSALQEQVALRSTELEATDKAKLEAAVIQHAKSRAAAKVDTANKEADVVEVSLKFRLADAALKIAVTDQKSGDADYNAADAKRTRLKSIEEDAAIMKNTPPSKADFARLEARLLEFGINESLVGTLRTVFEKDVATRSDFDGATLASLDGDLTKLLKDVDASLAELEPAKTERGSRVTAAQAAQEAAKDEKQSAQAAMKQALATVKECEASLEKAEAEEKNFANTLKVAQSNLATAEQELKDFKEGALADFALLKSQTTPPPPPPVEEPAPAEEPAPTEEPAPAAEA